MGDLLLKATPALLDGWVGPAYIGEGEERAAVVVVSPHRQPGMGFVICYVEPYLCVEPGDVGGTFAEELWLDLERDEVYDRVVRVLMATQGLDGAACWTGDDEAWQLGDPLGNGVEFAWEGDPGRVIVPELECVQNPRDALLIVANHVLHGEVTSTLSIRQKVQQALFMQKVHQDLVRPQPHKVRAVASTEALFLLYHELVSGGTLGERIVELELDDDDPEVAAEAMADFLAVWLAAHGLQLVCEVPRG